MDSQFDSIVSMISEYMTSLTLDTFKELLQDDDTPYRKIDTFLTGELINDPTTSLLGLLSTRPHSTGIHPRFSGHNAEEIDNVIHLINTGGHHLHSKLFDYMNVHKDTLTKLIGKGILKNGKLSIDKVSFLENSSIQRNVEYCLQPSSMRSLITSMKASKILEIHPTYGETILAVAGLGEVSYVGVEPRKEMLREKYIFNGTSSPVRHDLRGVIDYVLRVTDDEEDIRSRLYVTNDMGDDAVTSDNDLVIIRSPASPETIAYGWSKLRRSGNMVIIAPEHLTTKEHKLETIIPTLPKEITGWFGIHTTSLDYIGCCIIHNGSTTPEDNELFNMIHEGKRTTRSIDKDEFKMNIDSFQINKTHILNASDSGSTPLSMISNTFETFTEHICIPLDIDIHNPYDFRFSKSPVDIYMYSSSGKVMINNEYHELVRLRLHPCKSKEDAEDMAYEHSAFLINNGKDVVDSYNELSKRLADIIRKLYYEDKHIKASRDPESVLIYHRSPINTIGISLAFPETELHIITYEKGIDQLTYNDVTRRGGHKVFLYPVSSNHVRSMKRVNAIQSSPSYVGDIIYSVMTRTGIKPKLIWNSDVKGQSFEIFGERSIVHRKDTSKQTGREKKSEPTEDKEESTEGDFKYIPVSPPTEV